MEQSDQMGDMDQHVAESHTDEKGNVIYSCSMHPSVRQNEPGDCPICGMELIEVNDNSTGGNPNELTMSLAAMKLAEIETSLVRMDNPVSTTYLPGKVTVDERELSKIPAHFHGRIEKLYVNFTGEYISKGQKIARVYSPKLFTAQKELLQAYKTKEINPVLYTSARKKLMNWKLSKDQIDSIIASGEPSEEIDILSHKSGHVLKLYISTGDHLDMGDIMYEIGNLKKLWVMFDSYESDITNIKTGDDINFTVSAIPGVEFSSKVAYVNPVLEEGSRTVSIRSEIDNDDLKLMPGMLAEAIVKNKISTKSSLLVPKSAVLWTGPRSIVFVQIPNKEEPTFIAREVTLGKRVGDQYIILEGLEAGEEVVTHGNFKLDGAAQLADKLSMMNRNPGTGANRTGHEGHNMGTDNSNVEQNEKKQASTAFQSQLNNVVQEYLKLKDGLVMSDKSKVLASADKLENELKNVDMALVKGELHTTWMKHLGKIDSSIKDLKQSQNIEAQKAAFLSLSKNLIESVKTFGLPGVIYQQFCPMTDDGKGGYWLSESKEIANPYFGDEMHNCGETILKIES
ncbi:MAG: efflux RND transporter periplasmic adaptor subunit [Balneola sp.]